MLIELSLYTLLIVVISETDAADERTEGRLVFLIAGDGEGSHAPSVEGMIHGNDLVILFAILQPRVFAGRLNCALDSLGATVGEEYPAHAAHAHQLVGCLCGRLIVIQVGGMHQLVDLGFQCFVIARIMISQGIYSDTCRKIQIFLSFGIIEVTALAFFKNYRKTVICMKNTGFRFFHLFIHAHCNISPHHLLKLQYQYLCL